MVGDQSMRIADLLESRVAIISASLGLPIAWPNIVFDPPTGPALLPGSRLSLRE